MGAERVLARCGALAVHSEEPGRLTRRFGTPALRAAGEAVLGWMRAAGMRVDRDAVGNVVGRYEGTDPDAPALVLGSHLDTVRDAGRYDGALGVILAVEAVAALHERGVRLAQPVEVVGFADEEGVRYGTSYLGSAVAAGTFDPALLERTDADGVPLREAVLAAGGDPDALDRRERAGRPAQAAYVEVHIEQGPVLEAHGLPVGVVTAIAGQTRAAAVLRGVSGHAGTVPMDLRRDALATAAELVLACERLAVDTPGLVATVGTLRVEPDAINVIPGRVELSFDVRHRDDGVRVAAYKRLRAEAQAVTARRGAALEWRGLADEPAVACNADLVAVLEHAVEAVGVTPLRLPSGAGHDAAAMAGAMPVAMLFVRCAGGISHHPGESIEPADVAIALRVLERALPLLTPAQGGSRCLT